MRTLLVSLFALSFAPAALAQTTPAPTAAPAAPPARPDCSAAEHHQLDYWVGEWRVFRQSDGVEVASSSIQSVMNGCGISENYQAPGAPGGAYAGVSYSAYDRKDGKWHQFYVDVNGAAAWFTGGLEGGNIVLNAAGAQPGSRQRMTYRRNPDGTVNQIGEFTTDDGKTWTVGYDYHYRRR